MCACELGMVTLVRIESITCLIWASLDQDKYKRLQKSLKRCKNVGNYAERM